MLEVVSVLSDEKLYQSELEDWLYPLESVALDWLQLLSDLDTLLSEDDPLDIVLALLPLLTLMVSPDSLILQDR